MAVACGRPEDERFTDEAEIESRTQKPTISVTLRKSLNPENGRFEAVVVYDLRHAIAGRFVRVEHLSWTDADGTEHPASGVLWQITDPEQLSGMQIVPFDADSGARHVRILVTAHSCGTVTRTPGIDCDCASHAPVYFADGNMRLTDTDPLPQVAGQTLVRTYDSDEQVVGLFGRGFMTFLGMRLMRDQMEAHEVVSVVTEANDLITFQRTGNDFTQTWPGSQRALGTLTLEGNGEYTYRPAHSTLGSALMEQYGGYRIAGYRESGPNALAVFVHATKTGKLRAVAATLDGGKVGRMTMADVDALPQRSLLRRHAALRLHLLHQPHQRHRDLVERVDHPDLERRRRLARGAPAVRAGTAAAAIVVIEHMAARAGIFTELHQLPSSFDP